jgi:hypothetical protein
MTMKENKSDLTFEKFLGNYVKSLSLGNTVSVRKLLLEASTTNLRLVEPLILHILFNHLEGTYAKFKNNDEIDKELNALVTKHPSTTSLLIDLQNKAAKVNYQKVFNTYLSLKNKKENEKELKVKMISKVLELISVKKISKYRLSKELGINPGNLNSYLNHRKTDALNMQKCNKLINYLVSH